MLDYKRFISYLYSYVEGKKGINVGYIRLEQRQGICRLTMNIQDRHGVEDGHYKVYLYKMTGEGVPVGYYLDDVVLHRFGGDMRKQTNSQNVWNTGNRIEDFDGVIAIYDIQHIYVSQWSDETVNPYRFITWQDWAKREHISFHTDKTEAPQSKAAEAENRKLKAAQTGVIQTDRQEAEAPQTEAMQMDEQEAKTPQTEAMQMDGQEAETSQTEAAEEGNGELKATQIGLQTNRQAAETLPTISDLTIRLMENRPKLPDFENHEIYDCVRIEPNDIGLLEMDNWRLGVNSFLTHGFYNYKYLMLGKLRFQDGAVKAVLGVPGVYDNKEQYIAKIFGFEVFVPVKHTNTKTGNFGYWIVELV